MQTPQIIPNREITKMENPELYMTAEIIKEIQDHYIQLQKVNLNGTSNIDQMMQQQQTSNNIIIQQSIQVDKIQGNQVTRVEEILTLFFQNFILSDKVFVLFERSFLKDNQIFEQMVQTIGQEMNLNIQRIQPNDDLAFFKKTKEPKSFDMFIPQKITNPNLFTTFSTIKVIIDQYAELQNQNQLIMKEINLQASNNLETFELDQQSIQIQNQLQELVNQFREQCRTFFQEFIYSDKFFVRFNKSFLRNLDIFEPILEQLGNGHNLIKKSTGPKNESVFYKNGQEPESFELQINNPLYQRRTVRDTTKQQQQIQVQQQQPQQIMSTVPDIVSEYKIISVNKNSLTIQFNQPDDNGAPIDQYKLCLIEYDSDLVQPKYKFLRSIECGGLYQFKMSFAEIKDIDFGNLLFPFDKMLNIVVLAHNVNGWSINVLNFSLPVFLKQFISTTLYLKGSQRWGLFPDAYFENAQFTYQEEQVYKLNIEEDQIAFSTLCQTSFIPCLVEKGQVRDVSVKHSLLLLNEESNLCQWGEILVDEDISNEYSAQQIWDIVGPYELSLMEPVHKLACGAHHCICITIDGQLFGWGLNNKGQLGIGSIVSQTEPVRLSFFKENNVFIDDVRAGYHATICKSRNGQLFAWGERQFQIFEDKSAQQIKNLYGEVINYQCTDSQFFISTPKLISGLQVSQIAAGFYHFGAISVEGKLYVWGDNDNFCLGMNEYCNQKIVNLIQPIQLDLKLGQDSKIAEIAFGANHCLVKIREAKYDYVLSWGCNDMAQCGQGNASDKSQIGQVRGLPQQQIKQIDGGTNHSLFLMNDKLYGCGGNECYQLDNKQMSVFLSAVEIECLPNIVKIEAGHMVSALLVR